MELYHYNRNHDPKTGKFTFSRGHADRLLKLERDNPQGFYEAVNSIDDVKKFEKKKAGLLRNAIKNYDSAAKSLNRQANDYARKKVKLKKEETFTSLVESGDNKRISEYLLAGAEYTHIHRNTWMAEPTHDLIVKMRAYEKNSRKFADKFLGEYGNMEVMNDASIKFDKETGKISRQTLADRFAYEMYRHAGGKPIG